MRFCGARFILSLSPGSLAVIKKAQCSPYGWMHTLEMPCNPTPQSRVDQFHTLYENKREGNLKIPQVYIFFPFLLLKNLKDVNMALVVLF